MPGSEEDGHRQFQFSKRDSRTHAAVVFVWICMDVFGGGGGGGWIIGLLFEPLVGHSGPLAMMNLVRQMRGQWARGNMADKDLLSSSSCTLTPDKL